MTYNIRSIDSGQEAEAMVAPDSFQPLADRIRRMVTAGRGMILAVRECTYLGRPPVLYGGLRLDVDAHGGGFKAGCHDKDVICEVRLTNGGGGYDDSRWFGFSERTYEYSGNDTEDIAWQRYRDHKAEAANHFERRRNMTHVAFVGGLPGWKWQPTDRVTITEWNGDGVAVERVLGFDPAEGSW